MAMMAVMPAMVATVISAVPVVIAMVTPMDFGRHLPRSELRIILNCDGSGRIDEGPRARVLGRHGQNKQRAGCGKA